MLPLVQKHRRSGVLVDTNILMLVIVGSVRRDRIATFKRTKQFTVEDYAPCTGFLQHFQRLVTTPQILAEVSNFLGQLPERMLGPHFDALAAGIGTFVELYIPAVEIVPMEEFRRFGLTDAGIISNPLSPYLVLTDDFRLSQYLQSKGRDVVNFNHIRPLGWT